MILGTSRIFALPRSGDRTVALYGMGDIQETQIVVGGYFNEANPLEGSDDKQAISDALARIWEAFCADDSAWPAA